MAEACMDADWLDPIKPIFKEARKGLFYPPIVKVEPAPIETMEITFSGPKYRLLLGRDITEKFSNQALLGIFHHELNHWVKHPYDVRTLILEYYWLGETTAKDEIRNLFDDVIVNLDLIVNRGLGQVAQAYRELPAASRIDRLLRAFFSRVTGIDFGVVGLEKELQERLQYLSTIDFLDLSKVRLKSNIRRFAEVIGDVLDEESELPFIFFALRDFGTENITRAMQRIAGEVLPQEYQAIASAIREGFDNSGGQSSEIRSGGVGIGPGKKTRATHLERPDVSWYRSRARRYSISIESLIKQGSLYPDQITDFELDDSIDHFSPVESYGKVLPSLAKKHELAEFERYGEISVPDAVIIIDSSGSMPNPGEVVSYAVLGAFSLARNYLDLGASVGVINFSNVNLELSPTRNRQRVYEMLKIYQGHGTTLHIDDLDQYLRSMVEKRRDYILITDAGIDNMGEVVNYFSEVTGRLTIIWLKSESEFEDKFKENYELFRKKLLGSVTFAEVAHEQDIPRIAVGKAFGEVYGSDPKTTGKES
jgi:hypothetical protein